MVYLPDVSVIVPVHNSERTVAECVNSLLELNYPKKNLELIFVNNNSTDRTIDILNQYGRKIKILFEKKRGAAAARNRGLLNAKSVIVAFTDSDCVVDKDWLQNIVIPLQEEGIGIVGGKILTKRPCNEIEEFGEIIHDHNKAINVFKPPYVNTGNWASRLSVIKEDGLFDEDLLTGEDTDLSRRIFRAGYKLIYQPDAIVYHRNEKTFLGLFLQGYRHGFGSVRFHKTKQSGCRRFYLNSYIEILSSFINYLLRKNRDYSICYFMFNSGKKIGKIFGSIRFLYLEL